MIHVIRNHISLNQRVAQFILQIDTPNISEKLCCKAYHDHDELEMFTFKKFLTSKALRVMSNKCCFETTFL